MKRVRAQGCHTLYKSQVILSTKDTPPVPKLCIKSKDNRVLDGPTVIPLPATHLLEAVRSVQRTRRGVRLANLEVDVPDAARPERLDHMLDQCASQSVTASRGGDGEVQDLAFVRRVERDDVSDDPLSLDRKSTRLNSSHRCSSYAVF